MITKAQESQILDELEYLNIYDVYFHKGKLCIVNDYDVAVIEEYLNTHPLGADVELSLPDFEPLY